MRPARSGSIRISKPGTVLRGRTLQSVIVAANNVTIEDNVFTYGGRSSAITTASGYSGTVVRHNTIVLTDESGGANAGIATRYGSRVSWNLITGHGDGIKLWDESVYEYNYINVSKADGSDKHVDGMQSSGHSDVVVRRNWVQALDDDGGNSAIFIQAFTGSEDQQSRNILVQGNYFNGGNYTIFMEDGKSGDGYVTGVRVTDNRLGRDHRYGARHLEGEVVYLRNRRT